MKRGVGRLVAVGGATLTLLTVLASSAWAHVTVHSDDPVRGATDAAVMFRTPNEEDHAATVKLAVFFPTDHPLLDVLVEPHPGWTFTTKTAKLAQPVTTDDGPITQAVSEVTWTANSKAAGLQPGQATDFVVIVGQLPDTPTATFRAVQTYSNGDVVRWIEVQGPGGVEPEHPAPVLQLATAGSTSSSATTPAPTMVMSPGPTGTAASTSSTDRVSLGLAIAALIVALIAAGLAIRAGLRRP